MFAKKLSTQTVLLMTLVGASAVSVEARTQVLSDRLEWFKDQKFALFLHFGIYATAGIVESWGLSDADSSWSRFETPQLQGDDYRRFYFDLSRGFNPTRFNAEEWADEAVKGGFKYVLLTTKHHDGFCLYDSKYTNYKVTDPSCPYAKNPNADIVKRFFDASRARGLGISAYFSQADWHVESYWENHGIGFKTSRHPTYDTKKNPAKWRAFRKYVRGQLLELAENYGPLDMFWLDSGWVNPKNGQDIDIEGILDVCRVRTPGLLAVGLDSKSPYCDIDVQEVKLPSTAMTNKVWESCYKLGKYWGYHYDDTYKTPREVIHLLLEVVAKGGNLALGVGPMPDGRLPVPAVACMRKVGAWLETNGSAVYATRPRAPFFRDRWAFTQSKSGDRTYAIRLWDEKESAAPTAFLPADPALGKVAKVTHVKTGKTLPVTRVPGGFEIDFRAVSPHDACADAVVIE